MCFTRASVLARLDSGKSLFHTVEFGRIYWRQYSRLRNAAAGLLQAPDSRRSRRMVIKKSVPKRFVLVLFQERRLQKRREFSRIVTGGDVIVQGPSIGFQFGVSQHFHCQ